MSKVKNTGRKPSVTEFTQALNLFTDRQPLIEKFISYLNDDPPKGKILFFYGDGGNGKSLFLKYLQVNFCKRFKRVNWEWMKQTFSGEVFIEQIKLAIHDLLPVAYAELDFGEKATTSENRPQEAFYGLIRLRKKLAPFNVRFPSFNFACIWYMHKTDQLDTGKMKDLVPSEEIGLLGEITDIVRNSSKFKIIGSTASILAKRLFGRSAQKKLTVWLHARGLDKELVARIKELDVETDLLDYLPDFFADDLKSRAERRVPEKIVLFFDTHDAFRGNNLQTIGSHFRADEWLRRLLVNVHQSSHIVCVVAGRERPAWNQAPRWEVELNSLEFCPLGQLSLADAENFLVRLGITDSALRNSIKRYTAENNEIHPFFLGLIADIVLAAEQSGASLQTADFSTLPLAGSKEKELIDRLISYVDPDTRNAVLALAAARAFDLEIFTALGEALKFKNTKAAFQILTGFSFVWPTERLGSNGYRIHDLLRRLFRQYEKTEIDSAHRQLEKYYRELHTAGNESAIAEAIYHASQVDQDRGALEWIVTFEKFLDSSRYQLCSALLEINREMRVADNFLMGRISQTAANYFLSTTRYADAGQEYNNAISCYDKVLEADSAHIEAHIRKGLSLRQRGMLEFRQTSYDRARQTYNDSINAYNEALALEPDNIKANIHKGNVLQWRGTLEYELGEFPLALQSYDESAQCIDRVLMNDEDNMDARGDKGNLLQRRGIVQAALERFEEAMKSYDASVAAYDKVLSFNRDNIKVLNSKANVLQLRGDLEVKQKKYKSALKSYDKSIEEFEKALALSGDYVNALNNKASTLYSRGKLKISLNEPEAGCRDLTSSFNDYTKSLTLAGNDKFIRSQAAEVAELRRARNCK